METIGKVQGGLKRNPTKSEANLGTPAREVPARGPAGRPWATLVSWRRGPKP